MKKSNKLTFAYVIFSLGLLLVLIGGGAYGIYLSIGVNFVRSNVENVMPLAGARNMSVGAGSAIGQNYSSTSVIILSAVLVILGLFELVSMIKQIVFFKQFKAIKDSFIEKAIEKKVKSKKSVVVFASIVNVLSIIAGVTGIIVNLNTYISGQLWILYLIDGLVALFALISLILLFIKVSRVKKFQEKMKKMQERDVEKEKHEHKQINLDLDKLEYFLLKLKYLKSSKMISNEEYEKLRKLFFCDNIEEEKMIKTETKKSEASNLTRRVK